MQYKLFEDEFPIIWPCNYIVLRLKMSIVLKLLLCSFCVELLCFNYTQDCIIIPRMVSDYYFELHIFQTIVTQSKSVNKRFHKHIGAHVIGCHHEVTQNKTWFNEWRPSTYSERIVYILQFFNMSNHLIIYNQYSTEMLRILPLSKKSKLFGLVCLMQIIGC